MMDEDFVGRIKDIAAACADGTTLYKVPAKMIAKYRFCFWVLHKLRVLQ